MDPAKSGRVECVPVVLAGRAANEPGQQRTTGIGARTTNLGPGRENACRGRRSNRQLNLVGSCIPGESRRARRKRKASRRHGVDGARTLARDVVKSNGGGLCGRLSGAAVALAASALEHDFAFLLERVEPRIRIRQRSRALSDGVGHGANTMVREQHPLKRRQIVEQLLRGRVLNPRVIGERTERLLLERREPAVQLISTELVRAAWPRIDIVRSREGHVVHRRHAPPHVHERLGRRRVGQGIDEPDIRRQREGDPDETVLAEIAEITGALAIGPEVVCVERPKQRVVGSRIAPEPFLEELEPRLDVGGRALEIVRRHVAVHARAAVCAQAIQPPVEERPEAAQDRVAGLAAAEVSLKARFGAGVRVRRQA